MKNEYILPVLIKKIENNEVEAFCPYFEKYTNPTILNNDETLIDELKDYLSLIIVSAEKDGFVILEELQNIEIDEDKELLMIKVDKSDFDLIEEIA